MLLQWMVKILFLLPGTMITPLIYYRDESSREQPYPRPSVSVPVSIAAKVWKEIHMLGWVSKSSKESHSWTSLAHKERIIDPSKYHILSSDWKAILYTSEVLTYELLSSISYVGSKMYCLDKIPQIIISEVLLKLVLLYISCYNENYRWVGVPVFGFIEV